MQKELTTIEAALKGHNIILTATDPDGEEKTVTVPCDDIHEIYGCGCARWMEENGDRESSLWELFHSVNGIALSPFGESEGKKGTQKSPFGMQS